MKKEVLFIVLILLISMPFVLAADNVTKINNSYNCLANKVNGKCNTLSPEEKIFSLLSIEECKDYVINSSTNLQHWSSSLKLTSQAVLALDNVNVNVTNATNWLLSQNTVPSDIDWYLEVEGSGATTCTIKYNNVSYPIRIGTDKKINTNAGSCLSLSEAPYANYWLKIAPTCYNKNFDVSCNQSFLTTLLYKKSGSPIIYVSDKTSSASADGTTTEKVDFSCFKQANICNYEGSLWAAFVLDSLGKDISSYKPYLVTMAEDNPQYLPESFLYLIEPSDTNFRTIILSKQQNSQWWFVSGDKYYDTPLALLGFQNENPTEKINSKNWLLDVQDAQGCWQGNIRNTAFILYSIWSEYFVSDAVCGDNVVEGSEQCDDGNIVSGDGCSSSCQIESQPNCGNNVVDAGETCDDGNTISGDGCSSVCQIEFICGDNVINPGEQCDGTEWGPITECSNFANFTGGSLSCVGCMFDTSLCSGAPIGICSNGIINIGEQCDGTEWGSITGCSNFDDFTGGSLSCYATGETNECIFNTNECVSGDTSGILDCDDGGGYCIFETSCLDIAGSEISAYSPFCDGTKICCDTSPASQTCNDVGGEICASDETCSISNIETLDTYDCCTGYCEEAVIVSESECASDGGTCRDSCSSSEEENSDECDYIGEVCCEDTTVATRGVDKIKSYWWIWVLLILIVLVVLGIIFRDKLSPLWFRIKSKFKRKPKTPPGFSQLRMPMRMPLHRRFLPSRRPVLAGKPIQKTAPVRKPISEVDEVLKKLKEIGK